MRSSPLLALLPAVAAYTWGWTSARDLCGGIITDADDQTSATTVGVGKCEGAATEPTAFLKSSLEGLAFVDLDQYLACSEPTSCSAIKELTATGIGYRDYASDQDGPQDGSKYAYTMTGNVFGDMATAGGYVGVASYLNTGDVTISTKHTRAYVATEGGQDRLSRGDSPFGAPDGPYTACIADRTAAGECGAARTFDPSAYKFSIFGHLTGTAYATTVVAGQNGFPAGMDHLGFRMKLSTVGFEVSNLKVNGRAYDTALVNEEVTSLALAHSSGGINIEFPQKYNIGSTATMSTNGTVGQVEATKTVQIRIHGADAVAQYVYIDYLFESASLTAGKYFIYDPTITAATAGDGANSATTVQAVTMAAVALVGTLSGLLV
jgi:hypothetical protein